MECDNSFCGDFEKNGNVSWNIWSINKCFGITYQSNVSRLKCMWYVIKVGFSNTNYFFMSTRYMKYNREFMIQKPMLDINDWNLSEPEYYCEIL